MKKFFTIAAALMASMSMMADVIFSYTLTAPGTDNAVYDAVGGTAKCLKAMASSGSNEITIDGQTFYKFNSSSAWDFTLAEGTFAAGDVVSITAACTTSNKNGKGVTLNGIALTGDFPASTANTLVYTVQAGDAIDGQATIQVKRNDSDIKFGTIVVERENVTPSTDPVTTVTIAGPTEAYVGEKVTLKATTDVKADTIWWTDQYGAMQVSSKGTFEFTPAAVGSFTYTAWAENANNTNPANQSHTVVVTEAPPVTSCTNLIPASTGDDPVVGDEIALNAVSEGGKIFVAGMKNATGDIKYTAYGLQIGGGGADSLRVELNNYLKEGSIITLKLAAGGTS
ncbi:MAG: hypothetical protein J6T71_00525, partial [Paludibacteraceae bacterium]|nr:hypothetical protein [Paludibacteraceae bacterium]